MVLRYAHRRREAIYSFASALVIFPYGLVFLFWVPITVCKEPFKSLRIVLSLFHRLAVLFKLGLHKDLFVYPKLRWSAVVALQDFKHTFSFFPLTSLVSTTSSYSHGFFGEALALPGH